jgi:hypothetical protein
MNDFTHKNFKMFENENLYYINKVTNNNEENKTTNNNNDKKKRLDFYKILTNPINISNNKSNSNNESNSNNLYFPCITSLLFLGSKDIAGGKIINAYYILNNSIKKLDIIKNNILKILEENKDEIQKNNNPLDKIKYGLTLSNLIKVFQNTLDKTFKNQKEYVDYNDNLIKEEFNIFKNMKSGRPLFEKIFKREYRGLNKSFFIQLFLPYIIEKRKILNYRGDPIKKDKGYNGLLAFDYFLNLTDSYDIKKLMNDEKEKLIKKNKNEKSMNINYNKYIINVKNYKNNVNNKDYKIFSKMDNYNLLYFDMMDKNVYKSKHLENINNIYKEFYNSLQKCIDISYTDLYDNLVQLILLDFNMIKLFLYYVHPKLFNTSLDIGYLIKNHIFQNINSMQDYYEDYKEWYQKFKGFIPDQKDDILSEASNFLGFLENLLKNI